MAESYNICLDVGGTKVLGAIFNEKDEIIYRLKKRSVRRMWRRSSSAWWRR